MQVSMQNEPAAIERDTRFWDATARKYAAGKIGDMGGYEKTLARVIELLDENNHVLELGCGTGTTALRLAPHSASYLATDISSGMIEIANEKLAAAPCPRLRFAVSIAEQLPPREGGYDVVLGFNYLHLVPDVDAALAAVRNLVGPGGLFITKTPCLGEMNPLIRLAIPVMRAIGKAPESVTSFTRGQLEAAITQAGFEIASVEFHGTRGKDKRPFILARRPE